MTRIEELEQIIKDLLEWESNAGGWDAPVWRRARDAVAYPQEEEEED